MYQLESTWIFRHLQNAEHFFFVLQEVNTLHQSSPICKILGVNPHVAYCNVSKHHLNRLLIICACNTFLQWNLAIRFIKQPLQRRCQVVVFLIFCYHGCYLFCWHSRLVFLRYRYIVTHIRTFGSEPGTSRSMSLHKTTPSFREVFKNSSGSAMFFLGELSTPNDISHVTVCSSGFIAPINPLDHASPPKAASSTTLYQKAPHVRITLLLVKTPVCTSYPYRLTSTRARSRLYLYVFAMFSLNWHLADFTVQLRSLNMYQDK